MFRVGWAPLANIYGLLHRICIHICMHMRSNIAYEYDTSLYMRCHSFSARTVEQYSIWSVGRTPKSAPDVRDARLNTSLRTHKQISRTTADACWPDFCIIIMNLFIRRSLYATGLWNFDNSYEKYGGIAQFVVYCNDKMAGSFFWRRTDDLSEVEKAVIGDTVPTEAIEVRMHIYK